MAVEDSLRGYLTALRQRLTGLWQQEAMLRHNAARHLDELLERIETAAHVLQDQVARLDRRLEQLDQLQEQVARVERRLDLLEQRSSSRA